MSNGSISCAASVSTSSARSRRARMPAWMRGGSVLTRPPRLSGAAVTSSTRVTASPCSSRNAAVPPDETSSKPRAARPRAKSSTPVLSQAEIRALIPGPAPAEPTPPLLVRLRRAYVSCGRPLREELAHDGREQAMLDRVDALPDRLARLDGHQLRAEDRAGVDALVDEVDGDARHRDAGGEGVVYRVRARELRQEGGVDVDDAIGETVEERLRQQVHVAGEHDELDALLLEPRRHHEVALL